MSKNEEPRVTAGERSPSRKGRTGHSVGATPAGQGDRYAVASQNRDPWGDAKAGTRESNPHLPLNPATTTELARLNRQHGRIVQPTVSGEVDAIFADVFQGDDKTRVRGHRQLILTRAA